MELIVDLPEVMLDELRLAARDRGCSPRQFAIETLESAIASRRLSKVDVGTHGPQMCRTRGRAANEDEDAMEPEGYPVHGVKL